MQTPYPWEPQPPDGVTPPPLRHSGFGIASFTISLVAGAAVLLLLVVAGVMAAAAGGRLDSETPETVAIGCFIIVGVLVHLVGLALAIAGLVQRDRRRVFAILGLVLNGMAILAVAALVLFGTLAGPGT